jgi:hypothetical protein
MGDRWPPGGRYRRWAVAAACCVVTAGLATVVVPRTIDSSSTASEDSARAKTPPGTRAPSLRRPPAPARPSIDPDLTMARKTVTSRGCTVSAKLVPSCGAWWGVAPAAFTSTPRTQALHDFESRIGRTVDIYHAYHRGEQIFPTAEEMAIAREPGHHRMLLLNWKPDSGRSWAAVAGGAMDKHIDRLAAHVNATFPEKFFLVIHHEPEEEVRPAAGSGYTADDFRNMFRHVVERFRAKGVGNALFTAVFMGSEKWGVQPWFDRLYPGNDVVDWLGMDPYASAETLDFSHLVNQSSSQGRGFPGFYSWAGKIARGKPIMLSEWGVFSGGSHKPGFYRTVAAQLKKRARIKALVYFDTPDAPFAGFRIDTRIDSSPAALGAYRDVSRDPQFNP